MPYRCSALALWEVFRAITVRHYTKSFWTPSSLILDTPVQNHPVIAEPCLARRHPAVAGLTRELARHKVFLPFTSYHSPVTFSTHFGQSLRTFGWPLKTMLSFIYKIFKQHFGSRNCGTNLWVSRTRKMANTVSPWRRKEVKANLGAPVVRPALCISPLATNPATAGPASAAGYWIFGFKFPLLKLF